MVDGVNGQTGAHVPGFMSVSLHQSQGLVSVTHPAQLMEAMTAKPCLVRLERNHKIASLKTTPNAPRLCS